MRCFKSFDELFIDQEIEDIIDSQDVIHVKYDSTRKDIIFLLGILFAAGKRIQIDNIKDIAIGEGKSFNKMSTYWHKSKLKPEVRVASQSNKLFLICPVRNADGNQLAKINSLLKSLSEKGYQIYYPRVHTDQKDAIGYRICTDNANAIGSANTVGIYYDKNSKGSMFDLGVAYFLNYLYPSRNFLLLNEEELMLDPNDFGDRIVLKMNATQKLKKDTADVASMLRRRK